MESAGRHFAPQRLKNFVPEHPSLAPPGFMNKTMFSKTPGFFPPKYRSVTGCSQRPPTHFDDEISSSVEACLTTSTNSIVPLTRNPDGLSGRTRNLRIWQHQMRYLLTKIGLRQSIHKPAFTSSAFDARRLRFCSHNAAK